MLNQHPEALCGFLNNICDCHNSQFVYEPLQHIFTGDLDIIQSNGLRNIFKKGTKFRSITNKASAFYYGRVDAILEQINSTNCLN